MRRLLLAVVIGGFWLSTATAADQYQEWLVKQSQRGTEIEYIRVADEKPLLQTEETDQDVANILEEVEEIEQSAQDNEDTEESL